MNRIKIIEKKLKSVLGKNNKDNIAALLNTIQKELGINEKN